MMLRFSAAQQQVLVGAAREDYPLECCGLIIGRRDGSDWVIDELVRSENISPTPEKHFEVDMRLRLRLQRALRDTGKAVIGHYHSHPNGKAGPSSTDLASAWEDNMVWVIIGITDKTEKIAAFQYDADENQFTAIEISLTA